MDEVRTLARDLRVGDVVGGKTVSHTSMTTFPSGCPSKNLHVSFGTQDGGCTIPADAVLIVERPEPPKRETLPELFEQAFQGPGSILMSDVIRKILPAIESRLAALEATKGGE